MGQGLSAVVIDQNVSISMIGLGQFFFLSLIVPPYLSQLRKKVESPLVTLAAEGVWSADEDVLASYTIQEAFPACSYDWIGLYKVSPLR